MLQEKIHSNIQTFKDMEILEKARKAHENYLLNAHKKDLNDAIEYYIEAIKLNPHIAETYYRLASLLWENGQISIESAIKQCKEAINLSPNNPNAHLYTGYFLNLAGDFDEAEEEFKTAIHTNPIASSRARIVMAMMLLQKNATKKTSLYEMSKFLYYFLSGSVLSTFDSASLKMFYKNFSSDLMVFIFKTLGNLLEKTKNYAAAIKLYDIAATNTGKINIFFHRIGDIAFQEDAIDIAVDAYKNVLKENPYERNVLVKLATIYQTKFDNKVEEAIDCYTKLLELEPENSRIFYELGHLYLDKNDNLNAMNAFKLALDIEPENPYYNNSFAYSLTLLDQYDEAIEHYQLAIGNSQDKEWSSVVCQALGAVYSEIKENPEAALALFQTALVLNEKDEGCYISIGDIYFKNEEYEPAIKAYCDAIKLNPDNYIAYNKCAIALYENDFDEEAIVAYNKVIEINPDYAIAYNNLGIIYLDDYHNAKEALRLFELAIRKSPNYTLANFNAGRAAQELGQTQKAISFYDETLNLNKITKEIEDFEIETRLFKLFEI